MASTPASTPRRPGLRLIPALVLAMAVPVNGQLRRSVSLTGRHSVGTSPPDPVAWLVHDAAAALAVQTPASAPGALLLRARELLREGTPEERAAAALLLGYAGQREDRGALLEATGDPMGMAAEHALVGLGLLGDSASRLHLVALLDNRKETEARKTMAAFGLGLAGARDDEQGGSDHLKVFAMELQRLSHSRHAAELAACFLGFAREEGRAVLVEFLELNNVLIPHSRVETQSHLHAIAVSLLANRFATAEEWILVRQGMGANRRPMRRFLTCWSLYRHPGGDLSDKLRSKVTRQLLERLTDRYAAVRSMALLALSRFNEKQALRRARAQLKSGRTKHALLGASFLVVGRLGEKRDLELLRGYAAATLEPTAAAAWALAASELGRRLNPAAWPHPGGDEVPFPLGEIRAQLGAALAPAEVTQAACAIALARLGDAASTFRLRELYFRLAGEDARRIVALALLRLDPRGLDPTPHGKPDDPRSAWLRLVGWGHAAAPQLWTPLLAQLEKAASPVDRAALLRLASIALAGPTGRLGDWIQDRVGSAALPPPLDEIRTWQSTSPGVNIGDGRRR